MAVNSGHLFLSIPIWLAEALGYWAGPLQQNIALGQEHSGTLTCSSHAPCHRSTATSRGNSHAQHSLAAHALKQSHLPGPKVNYPASPQHAIAIRLHTTPRDPEHAASSSTHPHPLTPHWLTTLPRSTPLTRKFSPLCMLPTTHHNSS